MGLSGRCAAPAMPSCVTEARSFGLGAKHRALCFYLVQGGVQRSVGFGWAGARARAPIGKGQWERRKNTPMAGQYNAMARRCRISYALKLGMCNYITFRDYAGNFQC